jgi:hypothetical protein
LWRHIGKTTDLGNLHFIFAGSRWHWILIVWLQFSFRSTWALQTPQGS